MFPILLFFEIQIYPIPGLVTCSSLLLPYIHCHLDFSICSIPMLWKYKSIPYTTWNRIRFGSLFCNIPNSAIIGRESCAQLDLFHAINKQGLVEWTSARLQSRSFSQ